MLIVFVNTEGKIVLTYPAENLNLQAGDFVCIDTEEYLVTKKRFNLDIDAIEITLNKVEEK